jgi:hypothetical protein
VFSFEAGNLRISPAIAIKSPAMNFPSMGLMFKIKSRWLFYFNSVNLSFAGTYSRSEQGIIIRRLKTNLSVWAWLRFELNFVYEKALLWLRNESMAIFFLSTPNPRPIYEISITSGFYLTVSFTSEDKYAMNEGWRSDELIISLC